MNKSRLTVTYSEEGNTEGVVCTFTKEFDSRPNLEELDEFFEKITASIDPDSFESDDECECCCDCNEDEETEFVLQMADMVEDIFEDQVMDLVEEFVDSVIDEVDGIKDERVEQLFNKKIQKYNELQLHRKLTDFDLFRYGFWVAMEEVENIMLAELDELREDIEHDCDGCCAECAPSRLY